MLTIFDGKRLRRMLLPTFVVLMLAFGVLSPTPVRAACPVMCVDATAATTAETTSLLAQWAKNVQQWAQNFALLGQIIDIITSISNALGDFMDMFSDDMSVLIATTHTENALMSKMGTMMHEDMKNTVLESQLANVEAQIAGDHTLPPDSKNRQHCYTPVVRMGLGLQSFPSVVTQTVEDAINNSWRGPGMDGTGPSTAGALFLALYGQSKLGWEPMGSPVDNPPNSSMVSTDPVFYDAAINAKTLDQVLEYPPHSDECGKSGSGCASGEHRYVPKPTNKEQKLWVAAELFCYLAAGPRPTPPASKAMTTPDGIVVMSQWSHCNSIRTAFVQQCAAKIAKHTRPDCSGSDHKDECEFQHKVCNAAKKAGVDVKNVIGGGSSDFDCDAVGLSPYQMEYLARLVCLTGQRYNDTVGGGATGPQATTMSDICDQSMATWRSQLAGEETAFVTALMGVHDLKSCWPAVNLKPALSSN